MKSWDFLKRPKCVRDRDIDHTSLVGTHDVHTVLWHFEPLRLVVGFEGRIFEGRISAKKISLKLEIKLKIKYRKAPIFY